MSRLSGVGVEVDMVSGVELVAVVFVVGAVVVALWILSRHALSRICSLSFCFKAVERSPRLKSAPVVQVESWILLCCGLYSR